MNLNDNISTLKGIGPKKAKCFEEYNIRTLEDLMMLFPRKYEDRRNVTLISEAAFGKDVLIEATVLSRRYSPGPYRKKAPLKLLIGDDSGTCEVIFFNGRFLANLFNINQKYVFYGRISENMGRIQLIHPEFHKIGGKDDIRGIVPVYPAIEGISQQELRKQQLILKELYPQIEEWLPENVIEKHKIADPQFALENIHFPKDAKQVLMSKYRFVFEELFTLEAGLFYIKNDVRQEENGAVISAESTEKFIRSLSFELTSGQKKAWKDISEDLQSSKPMNRLIQGDVGSGKTAIAEAAMFSAVRSGYQSVMMAPTEILAKQHLQSISSDFSSFGINVGLLCSNMKAADKRMVLEQLKTGQIDVLVGTHAVISPEVEFKNLGLVITDEQHRFGVRQRSILTSKGDNPNVLVMTATPIPRTLAVILYGDLDISQIRTMPLNRLPVKTLMFDGAGRDKAYGFVKEQLNQKKQAYVVCPLIEESEKINAKSAEELYEELTRKFTGYRVSLLHGNMKQEEKDRCMDSFAKGEIDILVSTVVIEVGINVPNATVMVIENSERFGLAQLHQLRGRVGRGKDQSYCFLICENQSEIAMNRSRIMTQTNDGFEIAEEDLKLRGPGELFGTRQHGLPQLQISDLIKHADILETAKNSAKETIENDPLLVKAENKLLKARIKRMFGNDIRLEL